MNKKDYYYDYIQQKHVCRRFYYNVYIGLYRSGLEIHDPGNIAANTHALNLIGESEKNY